MPPLFFALLLCVNCRYVRLTQKHSGYVLDATPYGNLNAYVNTWNQGDYQLWEPIDNGNGSIVFRQKATGWVLDADDSTHNAFINVAGSLNNGADKKHQTWDPILLDNGSYYKFFQRYSGLALDAGDDHNVYVRQSDTSGDYQSWVMTTWPPTTEPTNAPSQPPTQPPTNTPSNAPILTPTYSPSLSPTNLPISLTNFDSYVKFSFYMDKLSVNNNKLIVNTSSTINDIENIISKQLFISQVSEYH
eukprot:435213_1